MQFGVLDFEPLSVAEVTSMTDLDGQHVGVHGILYYGEGCEQNEFVLLPKSGPFDGVDSLPTITAFDRNTCVLIGEPDLESRLGTSGACGLFRWKHDAIVVGQIRHQPESTHPVRIEHLWAILIQSWDDFGGMGKPYHKIRVVMFPGQLPELPWRGFRGERHVSPVIRVEPISN